MFIAKQKSPKQILVRRERIKYADCHAWMRKAHKDALLPSVDRFYPRLIVMM